VAQTVAVALMFEIGHAGLTLATSTGATVNALLLYRALRRGGIYTPLAGWGAFLGRLAVALAVLGAVLWWTAGPDEVWLRAGFAAKASHLALVVGAGALSYFAALWLLGFRLADFNRRDST
jgi:putative peptidoglycan lipid II flippase